MGEYEDRMIREIEKQVTKIDVEDILEPDEAKNERGNPEVLVIIHQMGHVLERYKFEVIRPADDEKYPRYRYGPYATTEGANLAEYMNDASVAAAKALAEHTGVPVEAWIYPHKELESRTKLDSKRVAKDPDLSE
ncbi:hypothetical protein [Haladaptatus sp. CMSO5]|uniref:hypothetical protein n=1 Tax=Haladaptatus sp. CMSO5 TaxID=3120514 RepID=UPI002FCDE749